MGANRQLSIHAALEDPQEHSQIPIGVSVASQLSCCIVATPEDSGWLSARVGGQFPPIIWGCSCCAPTLCPG
ncbi:hypothetical protein SCLCIDRAFT_702600 [Scleroderma citrinum Foug A]|uniref:Uncharacterized protein n=1 Tax=Scleroderma citrinum Foug A TaxID=1036808 RepID=A0A0C3EMK6_9AGAM|nr:hypothetical protein SCLCIDRAFT_702600 [Scleroderma citrinum Foug A]